jgi:hypothetical protein
MSYYKNIIFPLLFSQNLFMFFYMFQIDEQSNAVAYQFIYPFY